jgi:hypothetical protein
MNNIKWYCIVPKIASGINSSHEHGMVSYCTIMVHDRTLGITHDGDHRDMQWFTVELSEGYRRGIPRVQSMETEGKPVENDSKTMDISRFHRGWYRWEAWVIKPMFHPAVKPAVIQCNNLYYQPSTHSNILSNY